MYSGLAFAVASKRTPATHNKPEIAARRGSGKGPPCCAAGLELAGGKTALRWVMAMGASAEIRGCCWM